MKYNYIFPLDTRTAMQMAHLNQPAPDPLEYNKVILANMDEELLMALAKAPEDRQGSVGEIVGGLKFRF